MITQAELQDFLAYDSVTGSFTKPLLKGFKTLGSLHKHTGYLVIQVNKQRYQAHHLAWLYTYGVLPKQLDHINGNKQDNSINNLRLATTAENNQNEHRARKHNKSGFLGVVPARGKFAAYIRINYKCKFLGYFETPEEAHQVYLEAKRELHSFCTI
jgi:hypothetical protein